MKWQGGQCYNHNFRLCYPIINKAKVKQLLLRF
jgi:hypothetical protein